MSNDITGSPLIIDTASSAIITTTRLHVIKIRWYAPSASAGNAVTVQDAGGVTKWPSIATGSNYVEVDSFPFDAPLVLNGLIVPTLASGTLYLYLRQSVPV